MNSVLIHDRSADLVVDYDHDGIDDDNDADEEEDDDYDDDDGGGTSA
jgi:hypothetical protein